jgi:hypothetical protein
MFVHLERLNQLLIVNAHVRDPDKINVVLVVVAEDHVQLLVQDVTMKIVLGGKLKPYLH